MTQCFGLKRQEEEDPFLKKPPIEPTGRGPLLKPPIGGGVFQMDSSSSRFFKSSHAKKETLRWGGFP